MPVLGVLRGMTLAIFAAVASGALAGPARAADFLVTYTMPAADVAAANAARETRREIIVRFLACAQEVDFMSKLFGSNSEAGEGLSAILIGKMAWLGQLDLFDEPSLRGLKCRNQITLPPDQVPAEFRNDNGAEANRRARTEVHPECDKLVSTAVVRDGLVEINFEVNGLCMRAQVNKAILNFVYTKQIGTNDLPCVSRGIGSFITPPIVPHEAPTFTKPGDQDVEVRDMTRIYFLNTERRLLDPETRVYLRDRLLTIHGRPDPGSYPIVGCGNTEQSSGTPQELLDERDFVDETLDDLGDAALWLARRAALFAALFAALATGGAALAAVLGAGVAVPLIPQLAAAAALIGTAVVTALPIPETENHRLMIESSRFLKNQIILGEVLDHPNRGKLEEDQDELKRWLLAYMGEIMRHDFAEYNARAYQRYSLVALLNLADFATDVDVRRGARMVIEFALAKFAVASREGVRVVPYRRLVTNMNKNPDMLDFGGEGSDHPIAMMLFYAGQTQRLPTVPSAIAETAPTKGLTYGGPSSMIYAATSSFAPDDSIIALAIDKSASYFQRIHHAGVEIYTSTPSYTLTAGGIRTPQALTLELGPISEGKPEDLGTGVPTSLIPSGTQHVNRLRFMRFEGLVDNVGAVGADGFGAEGRLYDRNTCVWHGFACGINYADAEVLKGRDGAPMDIQECFTTGLAGAPPAWRFLNSRQCRATVGAPAFFVARFLLPCANTDAGCAGNGRFGFFEAFDASAIRPGQLDAAFDDFRRRVVADNPVVFPGNPSPAEAINRTGQYRMFAGNRERLTFTVGARGADPGRGGVLTVNDQPVPPLSDWPLAEGDVLNSRGDGIVRFRNPKLGNSITWDFSDAQHPKRTPTGN
jgi:hypothetical protein